MATPQRPEATFLAAFVRAVAAGTLMTFPGCSSGPALSDAASPEASTSAQDPATPAQPQTAASESPATAPATAEATAHRATAAEPAAATGSFPPENFSAPFEKTRQEGDGVWSPLGDAARGDRVARPPFALYKTTVHPHPVNRFFSVTVVAMDLAQLSVHLAAGTVDPKPPKAARAFATGLVPDEHLDSVVAVFNGGFQERHGRWGMRVAGQTFLEARPNGCTIAVDADEKVRIASWPRLEGGGTLVAFRQTPPCLVEDGTVHPKLVAGNDRAWGGHTKDVTTRRRSAIGIDALGRVLFYGVSVEAPARYLAEGLRVAGSASAAELDINWNWTRFLLVGEAEAGALQVTSTLVPGMPHGKYEYLKRPSARDFFYVRARGGQR